MGIYKLFKLARKFELKIVTAAADSKEEQLRKDLEEQVNLMARLVLPSESINIATLMSPSVVKIKGRTVKRQDAHVRAKKGIKYLSTIKGHIAELAGKPDLPLQKIIDNLAMITYSLDELEKSSGTDIWGTRRPQFLSIYDIFGSTYDTEFAYGQKQHNVKTYLAVLNHAQKVIRTLEEVAARVVRSIPIVKNLALSSDEKVSFDEITPISLKDFDVKFGIEGWHQQANLVKNIGLMQLPGMSSYLDFFDRTEYGPKSPENAVWNEFIASDQNIKEHALAIFHNPRYAGLRGSTPSQTKFEEVLAANPSIKTHINAIKDSVSAKLEEAKLIKEERRSQQLGSSDYSQFIATDQPMREKIKPPKHSIDRVIYDLRKAGDEERLSAFEELDFAIQNEVAKGEKSLDEAIGNNPKVSTPFEQIMKPIEQPSKPLSPGQIQDLVNRMSPKFRMSWLMQVRDKATPEEKNNIMGESDIISLINKYTSTGSVESAAPSSTEDNLLT